MISRRRSQRTYSLTSYTGVGQAPPNAPTVNSAALAAAHLVGTANSTQKPKEPRPRSVSAAPASSTRKRHSMTSISSAPPANLHGPNHGKVKVTRERTLNPDRSMSLTTTTIRSLGKFDIITKQETIVEEAPKPVVPKIQKPISDLESVSEDAPLPTTGPRLRGPKISFGATTTDEDDEGERHVPPPRSLSPSKPALRHSNGSNTSLQSGASSLQVPRRRHSVSFSDLPATNGSNTKHLNGHANGVRKSSESRPIQQNKKSTVGASIHANPEKIDIDGMSKSRVNTNVSSSDPSTHHYRSLISDDITTEEDFDSSSLNSESSFRANRYPKKVGIKATPNGKAESTNEQPKSKLTGAPRTQQNASKPKATAIKPKATSNSSNPVTQKQQVNKKPTTKPVAKKASAAENNKRHSNANTLTSPSSKMPSTAAAANATKRQSLPTSPPARRLTRTPSESSFERVGGGNSSAFRLMSLRDETGFSSQPSNPVQTQPVRSSVSQSRFGASRFADSDSDEEGTVGYRNMTSANTLANIGKPKHVPSTQRPQPPAAGQQHSRMMEAYSDTHEYGDEGKKKKKKFGGIRKMFGLK